MAVTDPLPVTTEEDVIKASHSHDAKLIFDTVEAFDEFPIDKNGNKWRLCLEEICGSGFYPEIAMDLYDRGVAYYETAHSGDPESKITKMDTTTACSDLGHRCSRQPAWYRFERNEANLATLRTLIKTLLNHATEPAYGMDMMTAYGDMEIMHMLLGVKRTGESYGAEANWRAFPAGYECCLSGSLKFMRELIAAYPKNYQLPFCNVAEIHSHADDIIPTVAVQAGHEMLESLFAIIETVVGPFEQLLQYRPFKFNGWLDGIPRSVKEHLHYILGRAILSGMLLADQYSRDPYTINQENEYRKTYSVLCSTAARFGGRIAQLASFVTEEIVAMRAHSDAGCRLGGMLAYDAPLSRIWDATTKVDIQGEYYLCNFCLRPTVLHCAKCKKAWYCCKDCQAADYPQHKLNCRQAR